MKTENIKTQQFSREGFLLTGLTDNEISYLQIYPDLVGPKHEMNMRLRQKVTSLSNWKHTVSKTSSDSVSVTKIEDIKLESEHITVFQKIPVPSLEVAKLIWKFHWINLTFNLPKNSRVLCIGASPGLECLIAKTMFPQWHITGVDFRIPEKPLFDNLLEMNIADIGDVFPEDSFDLCFSNHVLEHLGPTRERVLQGISKVLVKNGCFASAIPCDANPNNPPISTFFDILKKDGTKKMHLINPGHMWKTDIFDINDVLTAQGFSQIRFFKFKGSGADNQQDIYNQVPENIKIQENITPLSNSLLLKLSTAFSYFISVRSISDIILRWHYHKIRKNYSDHNLVPEILFCCLSTI